MTIWSDLSVDHRGNLHIELEREDIPLTNRWRASAGLEYLFAEYAWEYTLRSSYLHGQYC